MPDNGTKVTDYATIRDLVNDKKGEKDKIKAFVPSFQSILMKVVKSGTINKKTASRKISRISKKISN